LYQICASTKSCGTPRPLRYLPPRLPCAEACPCSARARTSATSAGVGSCWACTGTLGASATRMARPSALRLTRTRSGTLAARALLPVAQYWGLDLGSPGRHSPRDGRGRGV